MTLDPENFSSASNGMEWISLPRKEAKGEFLSGHSP
jgi:hypothetical protein